LCAQDFTLVNSWRFNPNITVDKEQWLTVSGWNEMNAIAQRYQSAFPTLLSSTYERRDFLFRHTNRQRTQATLRAFADGIFGFNAYQRVYFEAIPDPDILLRPHDGCPLYDSASSTQVERDAWQRSPEFVEMLAQVNAKLGLTGNQALSARQTRTFWEICNFEQLWDQSVPAPFCGVFSPANNLVLEYFEDIDYFWTAGYGGPRRLFQNLNCAAIQDMLNFLASTNPGEEVAKIYSTHSTAFQLFLVSLGVFEDTLPLTAANFAQQSSRQWRSSFLTPMATNLAVIRYE